jgi:hypothetical protein
LKIKKDKPNEYINIIVKYKDYIRDYNLYPIYTDLNNQNYDLILSTMCCAKDCYLLPVFTNYYEQQGIQHMVIYYNGKLTRYD